MAIEWKKIAYVENSAAQSVLGNPTGSPAVATPITVAEQTLLGRITGGNVDDLSVAQVQTLLGIGGATVSDTAYGTSWDGVTDVAPSKNAVYDEMELLATKAASGATLPAAPYTNQIFLHTPTGRKILYQYDGTSWTPIYAYGLTTLYVSTTGTDDQEHGTADGTDAFLTVTYALSQVPGLCAGSVVINVGAGTFSEDVVVRGKLCSVAGSLNINGTLTSLLSATMDSGVQGSTTANGSVTDAGAFTATVSTTVDATSAAGQKVLNVASTTGFAVGDVVLVNSDGARQELITVASIQTGVSLTAGANLRYEHTAAQADAVAQCQYAGKQIKVGSDIRVIDYHTASVVYICGAFSAAISGAYTIYDYGTILGASTTTTSLTTTLPLMPVYCYNIKFNGVIYSYSFTILTLTNCTVEKDSAATPYSSLGAYYCYFNNGYLQIQNARGAVYSCLFKMVTATYGVIVTRQAYADIRNGNVISGARTGVSAIDYGYVHLGAAYNYFRNCITYGISATNLSKIVASTYPQYTNCATDSYADAATFSIIT